MTWQLAQKLGLVLDSWMTFAPVATPATTIRIATLAMTLTFSQLIFLRPLSAVAFGATSAGSAERIELSEVALVVLLLNIEAILDRKSTRLNSSHVRISYAVF